MSDRLDYLRSELSLGRCKTTRQLQALVAHWKEQYRLALAWSNNLPPETQAGEHRVAALQVRMTRRQFHRVAGILQQRCNCKPGEVRRDFAWERSVFDIQNNAA